VTPTRRTRALAALVALTAAVALAGCAGMTVTSAGPVAPSDTPPTTPTGSSLPADGSSGATPALTTADAGWSPDAPPPPPIRIVTIGDSLMSGYTLDPGQAWPDLLAERNGVWVADLACAGMGFVADGDCGTDYAGMIPAAMAIDPDVVIIQSSDNDSLEDPDGVRDATLQTIQQLHDALPNARLVCLNTLWSDPEIPDEVQMTTDALVAAASDAGCEFVDIGQPLAGHLEWYQDDVEHPNAIGQQVLAAAIAAALAPTGVLGAAN
jgi:acyl-CoA thioesterase I